MTPHKSIRTSDVGPDGPNHESLAGCERGLKPEDVPYHFFASNRWTPLVVSVPHAGLAWPDSLGASPQVSLQRNADFAVDSLFGIAPSLGAPVLAARFSRLVVDLNRASDDVSPELVPDHPNPRPVAIHHCIPSAQGLSTSERALPPRRSMIAQNRGVLWATAVGNIPVLKRLSYAQFRLRIERFYDPYYRALETLLDRRIKRFGYAILLDAHSMPSIVGVDVVLGVRNYTSCAIELADEVCNILRVSCSDQERPWSLSIDEPYPGGNIVKTFGRPNRGVHALQIELNRGLYMDEVRLRLNHELKDDVRLHAHPSPTMVSNRIQTLITALCEPRDNLAPKRK